MYFDSRLRCAAPCEGPQHRRSYSTGEARRHSCGTPAGPWLSGPQRHAEEPSTSTSTSTAATPRLHQVGHNVSTLPGQQSLLIESSRVQLAQLHKPHGGLQYHGTTRCPLADAWCRYWLPPCHPYQHNQISTQLLRIAERRVWMLLRATLQTCAALPCLPHSPHSWRVA
ncbi:hypothetical protein E2C01_047948 [Portunus trituberculatus]|uniref:Uncharacterized protein n=1 Tax=Portunus trituberculatus TaxID=210409 RepID=A0A5B7G2E0_PORTR|nr:hypothetical protein [Portunus trituberculatus]